MTTATTGSTYEPSQAWREVADKYEETCPELWRKCYPRIYTGVGEYESPRFVALNLATAITWVHQLRAKASVTAIHVAQIASLAFKFGLPAFFVTREFLAAISQTELPPDTEWMDVKLPFDAGLLY